MAQYLCVALTFCLIILAAEARVLKSRQISLPDEPIVMDIAVRQKTAGSEDTSPLLKMTIEINGNDKKTTLLEVADQMPPEKEVHETVDEDFVPEIGPRAGIRGKGCALGYKLRGTMCFPG
ncbi:uncharacterized protein [Choristoneura fumiferana]|uniref:uncharacterized protein n=1 Tax=Choristoneura fumiferana TaxID=7141 RepID=UPI003D154D65